MPPPKPRKTTARERSAAFRAAEKRRALRRRQLQWIGSILAVLLVAGGITLGVVLSSGKSHKPSANAVQPSGSATAPMGAEGVPIEEGTLLAPVTTAATGATVDGIQCNTNEQVVYHIHTHLAVYDNGALRPLPPGIGIVEPEAEAGGGPPFYAASHCYYWLHVHTQDGIIHIEAPSEKTYTLGQFFAIWRQPLSSTQVATVHGKQTVYVNGKIYTGNPADITLASHEDIQIDVGSPTVSPQTINWAKTEL
jgi:hypothetical protein